MVMQLVQDVCLLSINLCVEAMQAIQQRDLQSPKFWSQYDYHTHEEKLLFSSLHFFAVQSIVAFLISMSIFFKTQKAWKTLSYIGSTIGNKNTPSSSQKLNSKFPKTLGEHYSKNRFKPLLMIYHSSWKSLTIAWRTPRHAKSFSICCQFLSCLLASQIGCGRSFRPFWTTHTPHVEKLRNTCKF